MKNPRNLFKAALSDGRHQLGIWNTIGGNVVPELLSGAGFDWVLVDCEHSAIETVEVLPALQSIAAQSDVSAVVRPATNDDVLIKRLLDMGAQTLLLPYIETVEEAERAVCAMHYGPKGRRGMAGMTRATRYGQVENYFTTAEEELCLLLQIETVRGLSNIDAIAATEGVDAIFFGPADLSASMGLSGQVTHPDVTGGIMRAGAKLSAKGVPWGTMMLDPALAREFISAGCSYTAVGVDMVLLANAVHALRQEFE
ncbi:MAG: HpcH/HpaI aldolase/citrate lyase family protein [Pseudomonadota bacterium]